MTIMDMLGQSGVLTLLGMGIVFSFLIIMIISITLAGKAIHALGADRDTVPARTGRSASAAGNSAAGSGAAGNSAVTAAISAAVNEYRKR